MQETGNLKITDLVQQTGSFPVLLLTKKCSFHIKSYVFSKKFLKGFDQEQFFYTLQKPFSDLSNF